MLCPKCNLPIRTGAGPWRGNGHKPDHNELTLGMVNKFNKYWVDAHTLSIKFNFTWDDHDSITTSEPAILRNELLNLKMGAMALPDKPVIVEPFAGCGADTITFLYNMSPKSMYVGDVDQRLSNLLQENVKNFQAVATSSGNPTVHHHVGNSSEIFEKVALEDRDISLLYLDPPWHLEGIEGNVKIYGKRPEADAPQLISYLMENVFDPMVKSNLFPNLIVIKTRFGWEKLSGVMHKLPKKSDGSPRYIMSDTIFFTPINSPVHFHTLQTTSCVLHQWHHSKAYDDVYGKRHPVEEMVGPDGDLEYKGTVQDK
jgi:hypothetical protein